MKKEEDIKSIVEELVKKYDTRKPKELAEKLHIIITEDSLGSLKGYYVVYCGIKCICVNSEIKNVKEKDFVIAHEIGHAIMHGHENVISISRTNDSIKKIEIAAHEFAAELLIDNELTKKYSDMTKYEIARVLGYLKY